MVRAGARSHAGRGSPGRLPRRPARAPRPPLLPFEVTNGLEYAQFPDEDRVTVAAKPLVEYDLGLRQFANVGTVAEVAVELDLTVYDASSISLAAAADGRAYTADEHLLSAVSGTECADRLEHIADYR